MALTPEEFQGWRDRHAALAVHMMAVQNHWRGERSLDPQAAAAYDLDYTTLIEDFARLKVTPKEVWDELLADDDPDEDA